MGERMTSAEARAAARGDGSTTYALRAALEVSAAALEAWEAEAAAGEAQPSRRPELARPWVTLYPDNECGSCYATREEAVAVAKDHGARAIRLAVVEVAEPETPTREQGPSGWWYERREMKDGVVWVKQYRSEGDVLGSSITDTTDRDVPPADRALVARLLGEVG